MTMRFAARAAHAWLAVAAVALMSLSQCMRPTMVWGGGEAEVYYARGLIAYDKGDWEAAQAAFERAVAADPQHAHARYYRGLAQARRGQRDAAIADFEAALAIDPSLEHVLLDIGIAHFDGGEYAEAAVWLERAYTAGAKGRTAAFYLGLTNYRLGNYTEAVRYLDEAKGDPELRQAAHYYSGLTLSDLGRYDEARVELASAASVSPQSEIGQVASRHASGTAVSKAEMQPWSVRAGTQLGYDSNVTIGASDGAGKTGEDGDGAWVLDLGGDYRLIDSDVGVLRGSGEISQSVHFNRSDFDLTGTRLRLDWMSAFSWVEYGLSAGYDFYGLDYQSFYQDALLTPWVGTQMGGFAATQLYYGFRYRDFFRGPFSPYRDGMNNSIGVQQFFLLPDQRSVVHVGYRFDAEDPDDVDDSDPVREQGARDFEYDAHQFNLGIAASVDLPGIGALIAEAEYLFRYRDYSHPNSRTRNLLRDGTVTGGKRRDDTENEIAFTFAHDLAPAVDWLKRTTHRSEVTLTFIGVLNDSNISEFEYDRFIGLLGFRVWF
jgi:Tfp pilus assembly protein PilF